MTKPWNLRHTYDNSLRRNTGARNYNSIDTVTQCQYRFLSLTTYIYISVWPLNLPCVFQRDTTDNIMSVHLIYCSCQYSGKIHFFATEPWPVWSHVRSVLKSFKWYIKRRLSTVYNDCTVAKVVKRLGVFVIYEGPKGGLSSRSRKGNFSFHDHSYLDFCFHDHEHQWQITVTVKVACTESSVEVNTTTQ